MYREYYNLKAKPFDISPDPKFAWLGDKHAEAIAMMEYGIKENSGFIMLTGDVGVGKTLMVNCLCNRMGSDVTVVKITNPKMSPVDFFNFISAKLGYKKKFNTKGKFLLHFENYLYELYANNKQMILIIDEAQKIDDKLLEEIRLLSNIELEYKKLVNIFIVGQKELENLVNKEKNKSLRERIVIRYSIEPLSENETELYVKYRLKKAGSDSDIFKSDAIQKIHSFSNGIPRRINILCDRAMLTGFTSNIKEINSEIIEECAHHLRMISDAAQKENFKQSVNEKKRRQPDEKDKDIRSEKVCTQDYKLVSGTNKKINSEEKPEKISGDRPQTHTRTKFSPASQIFAGLSVFLLIIIAFFVYRMEPRSLNDTILQRLQPKVENKGVRSVKQDSATQVPEGQTQTRTASLMKSETELEEKAHLEVLSRIDKDSYVDMKSENYYPKMNLVVYFEKSSNELNDKAVAKLDRIVDFMTKNPDTRIKVKGYTDNSERSDYSSYISDMRASIIKTYLENKGILDSRINAKGLGSKNPLASNETQKSRK